MSMMHTYILNGNQPIKAAIDLKRNSKNNKNYYKRNMRIQQLTGKAGLAE